MTSPAPTPPFLGEREAVARTLREQVRDCIGETIPLRRRWVSAIMDRVVSPLRTENETLRAEREQSEKHRNDLMDSIVSLKTERGALRTRLATAEAERDAAIARTEEAEGALRTILYFSKEDPDLQPRYAVAAALKNVHLTARAALTPEHPHGD